MQFRLLTGILLLLLSSFILAQEEDNMTLNLNDADIRAFITTVSEMTGKNFIIDPRVKGRVTVVFSTPTTRENIYDIFLSVLKVHGFSAIPSGNAIKIVPDAGAKQDNIPTVLENAENRDNDKLLTRVVQVNHADATQLVTILRPLLPQHAHIAAHPGSNTLVIADTAANVNRIVTIIHRIDQANNFGIQIIKLKHAQANQMVQTLKPLIQEDLAKTKGIAQNQSITADERTNSLILNGDPNWRLSVRQIIYQLDSVIENEGNTEVIYLQYANAKELSDVLKGVGDKMIKNEQGKNSGTTNINPFDIQADETTNALVVTAQPNLMKSLKGVIQKLDIRREQVHIEAIIVELKDDMAIELGIEWQTAIPSNGVFAGSRVPLTGTTGSSIGSFPDTIGNGISFGYFSGGSIRALLKAFSSNGDNNILSTPSLVTLDNEEASIHVGQNVPFVTGQFTNNDSNAGANPFQTIERHDVGIKLNVTPHINDGNTIKLKIEQEVSSVEPGTSSEGLITNKRAINTTVLVDDGEIVVLGGLIDDTLSETQSKVPVLGDLPLLGVLFSNKRTVHEKKNLMVFLRPQILRDKSANRNLAKQEYTRIRNNQLQNQEDGVQLIPYEKPPLLPEITPNPDIKKEDAAPPTPEFENVQKSASKPGTKDSDNFHLTFPSSVDRGSDNQQIFLDY
ncbi:type II secretion system secretin GspD [Sedimenticola hydrogenitrophicus]|uniref:type II secretion system secretin GspD n=1 Tax=Sedimenticola hydrogenitrophicus TaxID=2967975 RepID=UPI0023AFDAB5|nr:type II secretion system secretin GspD [Sedimenticola hydrogenitrophicus]